MQNLRLLLFSLLIIGSNCTLKGQVGKLAGRGTNTIDFTVNNRELADFSFGKMSSSNQVFANAQLNFDSSSVILQIINGRPNPIFIYGSMFKSWTLLQPYVLQVDTLEKRLLLSLTPTYGNFKVYQEVNNFRLYTHYNWYEFIKIEPNEALTLELDYHFNDSSFYSIETSDPFEYNSILQRTIVELTNRKTYDFSISLRFALFDNIRFLTDPSLYSELRSLRDDFEVFEIPAH